MRLRRIALALLAPAAMLAATTAIAPAASAATAIHIITLNGHPWAAGADCITTGCTVKSKTSPGRTITWDSSAGSLRWSNGGHIGMDVTCAFIVTNPPDDFGTIWSLQTAPGSGVYFVNHRCGGEMGTPNNSQNTRWGVCSVLGGQDCTGWFMRMTVTAA